MQLFLVPPSRRCSTVPPSHASMDLNELNLSHVKVLLPFETVFVFDTQYNDTKHTFRLNHRSAVNGYLNRLLSFSSTPQEDGDTQSHLIKDDEADENRLNRSNSDYFFHDAVPDGDRGEGMKTIMDVVHPNTATQDQNVDSNKSSSSLVPRWGGGSSANSLIRRSSFSASRGRGLVNPGRQQ